MNPSPSEEFTPDTGTSHSGNDATDQNVSTAELRQAFEGMFLRQQQLEAELASMRAAASRPEPDMTRTAPTATPQEEVPLSTLMRTLLQTLTAASAANSAREPSGPREWKPPSWDGRADTFRDYLLRIRSSYRVRLAVKPTLPEEYYWDTVYNTLPARERARMRHFWEKGSPTRGKDPEAFFAQLEDVFADSNEKAKALEQLTLMKHSVGQPWHDHQLEFDGLLLSADGESWSDTTKIGYLKNTFSNPAKLYTAAVAKTEDYYVFSEEVERIMTNLETTDQFKAANKRWMKERHREPSHSMTVTAHSRGPAVTARVDADGDTVMAPTRTNGPRDRMRGARKDSGGKQRAKWVNVAEREKRREKGLCFRCGGSGHRIRDCPYAAPMQPTAIHAVTVAPMLEDDPEDPYPATLEPGKE